MFQSQETSITWISACPAALAGAWRGHGSGNHRPVFLVAIMSWVGVPASSEGHMLSHFLVSHHWGWGSGDIYYLILGPPHSVTVPARLLKAREFGFRTPNQAPGICLVISLGMELWGWNLNPLPNWEGSTCEHLTSPFLSVGTAACFLPHGIWCIWFTLTSIQKFCTWSPVK